MLVVEPARREEVDRLVDLARGALTEAIDGAWLSRAAAEGLCLVARETPSDRILGFALARREPCCQAHLLALAVDPFVQGQGVGTALLRSVQEEMMLTGAMDLRLEVRCDNPRAQSFYARHGFAPEGVQSHAYADGEDAVCLRRPL